SGAEESRDQCGPEWSGGAKSDCGRRIHPFPSSSGMSSRTASSASATGDEITYAPLAHLPRSIRRQRSLQKGKSVSVAFVGFLQIGHRSLMGRLRGIFGGLSMAQTVIPVEPAP